MTEFIPYFFSSSSSSSFSRTYTNTGVRTRNKFSTREQSPAAIIIKNRLRRRG